MPDSLKTVILIIVFLVPGYIATYFKNAIGYRKKHSDIETIIQSVLFSTLTYVILLFTCFIFQILPYVKVQIASFPADYIDLTESQLLKLIVAFIVVNISSVLIGGLFGYIERRTWIYRFLKNRRLSNQDGHITQWDKIFVDSYPYWAQVKSADGNIYQGRVVGASSYPEEKELVLTDVHYLTPEGEEQELGFDYLYLSDDELKNVRFTVSVPSE